MMGARKDGEPACALPQAFRCTLRAHAGLATILVFIHVFANVVWIGSIMAVAG